MERLGTIEIEVIDQDAGEDRPWHRTVVGEEARKWLSTNVGSWVETEHPGAWNHDVCMAVLAALDALRETNCPNRECAGCLATERGIVKVLSMLPKRYQDACLLGFEHAVAIKSYLEGGHN